MRNFAKALADYLAGPPKIQQNEFAEKCGIATSKLCRILSDSISIDRHTLDSILDGMASQDYEARTRLVSAYIRDVVSPGALLHLKAKGSANEWAELEFTRMSPKGQAAFKGLMRSDHMTDAEKIIINLAVALDLV
jgi:hypothetical protein